MPLNDEKVWAGYAKGVKRLREEQSAAPKIKHEGVPSPSRGGLGRGASDRAETCEIRKALPSCSPPSLTSPARGEESVSALSKKQSLKTASLDKRTERQIRQGNIEIEARLDLHGLTQEKAYAALTRFVEAQSNRGCRRLLVVTGKGHRGESVLRANFPRWCAAQPLAEHILALRPAAPKHGGAGAWYVMLRRQRGAI